MVRPKLAPILIVLLLLGPTLLACGPTPTTVEPTLATRPTYRPPEPTIYIQPKTLVVCIGKEPTSLYPYATSEIASAHIWAAIYDGPIDTIDYAYQAVALEKIPSLNDGDATIQPVSVGIGSRVVNDAGEPIDLTEAITKPVMLRPAGCVSSDCAVPWLPISGTLQMDQMAVTFKFKTGLTWADGTPVRAEDSVYAWKLAADPATPNSDRSLYERSASYIARDDYTIIWTGLPGYRDSAYMTNIVPPLPKHQLDKYTAQELVTAEESARLPLGYGPFTTAEWVAGDHITLVKNPYYFRNSESLPRVDQIIVRFIGEDANSSIAAALAGECDILTQDTGLDNQTALLLDLAEKEVLFPVFSPTTLFEHLDWCIDPAESYNRPDFFADLRMREAIAMCIDRQQVVDELLYGQSIAPSSYIPPIHPLYDSTVQVREYDPAAARLLLQEMGWEDINNDGIRECRSCDTPGAKQGVTRLSFRWASTATALSFSYMRIFQENLRGCGIEVVLENVPPRDLFAPGPEGELRGRRCDLISFPWLSGVEPPCRLYLSSEIPTQENGWTGQNFIGFSDPEFDAACQAATQSLPGTAEYVRFHQEAQRIFAQKLPSLPLFLRTKVAAYRPGVKNLILDSTAPSEMWNAENLDLRP